MQRINKLRRPVMARVIAFYIPEGFKKPPVKWRTQKETSKVLEFPAEAMKKSA
jgi:hypothetical protein